MYAPQKSPETAETPETKPTSSMLARLPASQLFCRPSSLFQRQPPETRDSRGGISETRDSKTKPSCGFEGSVSGVSGVSGQILDSGIIEIPQRLFEWFVSLVDGLAIEPLQQFDYIATYADGTTRTLPWQNERLDPNEYAARFPRAVSVVETQSPAVQPMTLTEVRELATLVWRKCKAEGLPRDEAARMFTALWLEGRRGLEG